jgi:ATP-dependent Lon protease
MTIGTISANNNNGNSSPVGPRQLKLGLNSRREVDLLCLLYLQKTCAEESKAILKRPSAGQASEWKTSFTKMYSSALVIIRTLIAPDRLGRLEVQRDVKSEAPQLAERPPTARKDAPRSRWGASYLMVATVFREMLIEVRNAVMTKKWGVFVSWMHTRIETLQWCLYHQDHEYVLDFRNYPKMMDWLDWEDGEEDTSEGSSGELEYASSESSDDTGSPSSGVPKTRMILRVTRGVPSVVLMSRVRPHTSEKKQDDEGERVNEEEETDSTSSESESTGSEESDDSDASSPEAMTTGLMTFLMGLDKATSKRGGCGRNPSQAKTPESRQFMKVLGERGKGGVMSHFESLDKDTRCKLVSELSNINQEQASAPLLLRILMSPAPNSVKNEIMTRHENARGELGEKYTNWVNQILKMPFDKHITPKNVQAASSGDTTKIRTFLKEARDIFDEVVYGHKDAKDKLVEYIAQMTRRAMNNRAEQAGPVGQDTLGTKEEEPVASRGGLVLGIQGPFGNGKTTLVEKGVSKVLGLPFAAIPLGGASDGSFLQGHGFTYEGSTCGQIASTLMKTKCNNPIIYMDELDKVSSSYKGEEVINQLVHLTDPSQNSHFQDRYFGNIDFDLSQVTWVFSYNDRSRIPPVLRDRITEVQTTGFTLPQKQVIAKQFLVPAICREIGMPQVDVSADIIQCLIEKFTYEGGVRSIKKLLFDICRKLNMDDLCGKVILDQVAVPPPAKRHRGGGGSGDDGAAISTKQLTKYTVTMQQALAYLQHRTPMVKETIHTTPSVGRINGLYASSGIDMGGIIPIETKLVPSDHVYGLSLTGNLGKVMRESGTVAKTLALESTDRRTRTQWEERWKTVKESIHLHCPEGAVSKDGPSAGTALTVAMLSLLTGNNIRHDIGITGEINLFGDVMAIGGLRSKMYGAKSAGCRLVLYPNDNQKDCDKIARECPDLFENGFRAIPVATLADVLPHVLTGSKGLIPSLKKVMRKAPLADSRMSMDPTSTTTGTDGAVHTASSRRSTRIANQKTNRKRERPEASDEHN